MINLGLSNKRYRRDKKWLYELYSNVSNDFQTINKI